ncbi:MAG TPA: hypothetical protein VFI42_17190 [Thermomicrobiaceae bacterium]|nr:hypothetical protein [Thermomicrobiaceae bacterium]
MRQASELLTAVLEGAIALVALLIAGGLLYFVAGHLIGGARRQARKRRTAPSPGAVPNERHQNVTAVSVR